VGQRELKREKGVLITTTNRKSLGLFPKKMMKTVQFVVPLLVTTFGFAACASAEIYYPWCANYGSPGGSNCGFSTHEQCMATVSGIGGSCDPNPWYTPPSRNPSATAAFGQSRQQYRY